MARGWIHTVREAHEVRRWRFLAAALGAALMAVLIAGSDRARAGSAAGPVTLTAAPPLLTNQTSATFAFSSKPVAKKYKCELDGAGFTTCASPRLYGSLANGSHTFAVFAPSLGKPATTYTWTVDTVPTATATGLRRAVGYGRFQLRWTNPAASDFDHVELYVSIGRRSRPRTLVYSGRAQVYSNRRFKNGLFYRFRIVSFDHAKNASRDATTSLAPSALLLSPADGAAVQRPPLLRWSPVRHATFYNVQVYRNGRKILSAWPTKPRQALARHWTYGGRRVALRRGVYVWFVWPAFGSSTKSRYGHLLGRSSFAFLAG